MRNACARRAEAPPLAQVARQHRQSLSHVLLIGSGEVERARAAMEFHRHSPLARGPFVRVRCGLEEERVRCAFQRSLSAASGERADDPLRAAEGGTLFLDGVAELGLPTQRLFLGFLTHRSPQGAWTDSAAWFGRLAVGSASPLERAVAAGRFLRPLHDCLDKIRVELELLHEGGLP
jgi:Nif-specific regulatory protein